MSVLRDLVLGTLAALATILVLFTGTRLPEEVFLALIALPVATLVVVGVLGEGTTSWSWRLARSAVGTVLAAIAGFATLRFLLGFDWFDITEPPVVLALAGLAGACGGISAAGSPGRGLAMACGYILGFVGLLLVPLSRGDGAGLGFIVGFTLTLASGALVGTTLGKLAR